MSPSKARASFNSIPCSWIVLDLAEYENRGYHSLILWWFFFGGCFTSIYDMIASHFSSRSSMDLFSASYETDITSCPWIALLVPPTAVKWLYRRLEASHPSTMVSNFSHASEMIPHQFLWDRRFYSRSRVSCGLVEQSTINSGWRCCVRLAIVLTGNRVV